MFIGYVKRRQQRSFHLSVFDVAFGINRIVRTELSEVGVLASLSVLVIFSRLVYEEV